MNVQSVQESDLAIIRTDGYINNLGAERIEQECDAMMERGFRKFIINFAKSPIINSMGLSRSSRCSGSSRRSTACWRLLISRR